MARQRVCDFSWAEAMALAQAAKYMANADAMKTPVSSVNISSTAKK